MAKRIVSFSLWGDFEIFNVGAIANAVLSSSIYPGWKCRFYVHESSPIIRHLKMFNHVETVIMKGQPGWASALWRFLSATDSNLDLTIFRDCDSRLNKREKAAVEEWESSGLSAHVMRDVETHDNTLIPAGMFGVRGGVLSDMRALCNNWITSHNTGRKYMDEVFLENVIWPRIKNNVLVHGFSHRSGVDSARPFPKVTPEVGEYVGQVIHPSDGETALFKEIDKKLTMPVEGFFSRFLRSLFKRG